MVHLMGHLLLAEVAGIDPDVAQTPLTPEQLSKPSDFPEWLIFRPAHWNTCLKAEGKSTS